MHLHLMRSRLKNVDCDTDCGADIYWFQGFMAYSSKWRDARMNITHPCHVIYVHFSVLKTLAS